MLSPLALPVFEAIVESDQEKVGAFLEAYEQAQTGADKLALMASAVKSFDKAPAPRGLDDETKAWKDAMPNYLKEHGTEFNRWFACIYQCAHQESVTDDNAYLFESFGNNARKFLETYLFYKYPDKESFEVHLSRFFGEHKIPPILVRKVADELSHAQGDLENYGIPLDEPETHMAAKLILERLNALDSEQYAALVSTVKC